MRALSYLVWLAGVALAPAQAQTILVDNTTLNGSFESGSGITPSGWAAFPVSGVAEIANRGTSTSSTALVHSGSYSMVVGRENSGTTISNGVLDTGYIIASGDSFSLSFWYNGAFGWQTGDQISFQIFYTSDGTISGTPTAIYSGSVSPSAPGTGSSWQQFNLSGISATPGSVGRTLFVSFTPGATLPNNRFSRVDEVGLSVVPEPGVWALAGGASLYLLTFRPRRRAG